MLCKRQGMRAEAVRSFHAAWRRNPMFFPTAKECVATLADCVMHGDIFASPPTATTDRPTMSFTIVVCSIDDARHRRVASLYRRLFADIEHELVIIRNARSLASAYNEAVALSTADVVVLSHDDIDILADDFAFRLSVALAEFDAVGVVGSTVMSGPAVGWSGHPHLRGWITHRDSAEPAWQVDVLDPRPTASGLAVLDGVLIAARRDVVLNVPFDAETFDGFHLYDLDWRLSCFHGRLSTCCRRRADARPRIPRPLRRRLGALRRSPLSEAPHLPDASTAFIVLRTRLEKAEEVRAFFNLLAALGE